MKHNDEIKRQAMSAVANVKGVVAHVGLVKVTLGAAVYAAHIRQMDRQAAQHQPPVRKKAFGREI